MLSQGLIYASERIAHLGPSDDAVGPLYWEYGRRMHHDGLREFEVADALEAVGYDPSHAAAFDDDAWDPEIRKRMDERLALCGDQVGTPMIALKDRTATSRATSARSSPGFRRPRTPWPCGTP